MIVLSVNNPMNNGAVFIQTAERKWEKATAFTPGLVMDDMGAIIDGIHAKGAVIEPAPFKCLDVAGWRLYWREPAPLRTGR